MAFTPTPASTSSNTTAVLIVNPELDLIAQAIAQAQEQLQAVMEAQYWEELMQQWMEKGWENWMKEKNTMVVLDKKLAVVVIGMKCQKVSFWISLVMFKF